jgi:hypothetical protein
MFWFAFSVQILPITALAWATTALVGSMIPQHLSASMRTPLLLISLLLYLGILGVQSRRWTLAFLLAFGGAMGAFLTGFRWGPSGAPWIKACALALLFLCFSGLLGELQCARRLAARRRAWGFVGVLVLTVTSLWVPLQTSIRVLWAGIGICFFTLLAAGQFGQARSTWVGPLPIALAVDTYLLGLSLAATSQLLLMSPS